jgi:hypothetical protein
MVAVLVCVLVSPWFHGALKVEGPAKNFVIDVRVCQGDPLGSREAGTIRYLAEPRAVTRSGRPATFLAGGHTPIYGTGGKVVFEPTGVQAEVLPVAHPSGVTWAEVNTTLRAVNVGLGNGEMPGFAEQNRREARVVSLGETFRIRVAADSPASQTWVEVTIREQSPVGK